MNNKITKFKDMEIGRIYETPVLLLSIDDAATKSGKRYAKVSFSDGEETIVAKVWDFTKENLEPIADLTTVVTATIEVQEYNGKSFVCKKFYKYDGTDVSKNDFILMAPVDAEKEYNYFYNLVPEGTVYGKIVRKLLADNHDAFVMSSAAKANHHNRYAGLVWHTSGIVRSAEKLTEVYPVDRNLLLAGAILHDIGKIHEYATDEFGNADYTIYGELFGHLFIGAEMVQEAARQLLDDPNIEEVRLLKHMIISHHGIQEYGAIVPPKIPEAMLLHYLDMIDSKIYSHFDQYKKLQPGEISTKVFNLDSKVYRSTLAEDVEVFPITGSVNGKVSNNTGGHRYVEIADMHNMSREEQTALQLQYAKKLSSALSIDYKIICNSLRCNSKEEVQSVLSGLSLPDETLKKRVNDILLFKNDLVAAIK